MLNRINIGWMLLAIGALLWFAFHIPSIRYGTDNVPLYVTHVGDEQVPVNGALHVLNEKNLLALRDANKAYYGPLMVMLAVPPAAFDFARTYMFEGVSSPLEYRNYVVWNWGGILEGGRVISVLIGFLGLIFFARILLLPEVNPRRLWAPVLLATLLLATEYFYFHYTAHFRHWVFLNTILLAQIYLYLLMQRDGFRSWRHWLIQAVLSISTFGISYLGILFNVVWVLQFFKWVRRPKEHKEVLTRAFSYGLIVLAGSLIIVLWHPHAFFRILGIVGSDLSNESNTPALEEHYGTSFSFDYYAGLLFNNHPALILAAAALILGAWFWYRRGENEIFSPVLFLLTIYVLLFGVQSHHSTHYFLPAIVLVHLFVGLLLVRSQNETGYKWRNYLIPTAVFFIGIQLAFNSAVLWKLTEVLNAPPPEMTLASILLELQEREGGKVLLFGCGPLPVPHTREAYADFASRAERTKTSLYSTMLADSFLYPAGVTLLDAYYDDNLPTGERLNYDDYDRVVVCSPFNPEGEPNKRLEHETNLLNYWNLEPYMDRYKFIKPASLKHLNVAGVVFR